MVYILNHGFLLSHKISVDTQTTKTQNKKGGFKNRLFVIKLTIISIQLSKDFVNNSGTNCTSAFSYCESHT